MHAQIFSWGSERAAQRSVAANHTGNTERGDEEEEEEGEEEEEEGQIKGLGKFS